jgi:hypothetical protein
MHETLTLMITYIFVVKNVFLLVASLFNMLVRRVKSIIPRPPPFYVPPLKIHFSNWDQVIIQSVIVTFIVLNYVSFEFYT